MYLLRPEIPPDVVRSTCSAVAAVVAPASERCCAGVGGQENTTLRFKTPPATVT